VIKWLPRLVALMLGAVLLAQWQDWPPPPSRAGLDEPLAPGSGAPEQTDQDARSGLQPAVPKESYTSVTERPLFRPDRRPLDLSELPTEEGPQPEETASLDGMDLSAVIITPTLTTAWVKDPSQPKTRQIRVGDDLGGWAVEEILSDRILLERQGERNTLILRDYSQAGQSMAPTTPTRPRPPRMLPRAVPGDTEVIEK
jgi:general secretion pathway protein N